MSSPKKSSYVNTILPEQAETLRQILEQQNWAFDEVPYAFWRARKEKTSVVAYQSGKLVIQGKKMADVIMFVLEPMVLKEARFGYEDVLAEMEQPEMFEPHAGIDESGKGDYFGPLVIAAVYVMPDTARQLLDLGVKDSKVIKSDKKIEQLAKRIRGIIRGKFALVTIGPEAYNRLYEKFTNVNHLLAWGHARALENLLERQPDCPRALSDQFARNKSRIANALLTRGRKIKLQQRTKAESDIAVAAASILARNAFVQGLARLEEEAGIELPKGASKHVQACAVELARKCGSDQLGRFVKLHFRTTHTVLAAVNEDGHSAENAPD